MSQEPIDPSQCAATYVRMSTDRQNYSSAHQLEHLRLFASKRGLDVVREYSDEGKSGLALKGRPGLRALLAAVQSDTVPFTSILVYDVSRWGRFQDVDESAYYEYICRSAGVEIIYCAETFENDGSPMASLLKSIKRTMAAEYSRELSAKVFNAQCRFISLGFKQGGSAGYGLRRLVVGPDGEPKRILLYGDRKGSLTDRVVFVLGPADEIAIIRRVYSLYVDDHLGDTRIAAMLNEEQVPSEFDRPWTGWLVRTLLTNEKYLGNVVFNRGSFKLKGKAISNPPEMWVRNDGAFESPLPPGAFQRAQDERARRSARPDSEALLQVLRDLFSAHGKVTTTLLTEHINSTMPKLLARRFGTVTNAYLLAGVPTCSSYAYVDTRRFIATARISVVGEVVDQCRKAGGQCAVLTKPTLLSIQGVSTRIIVMRCRGGRSGFARWKLSASDALNADYLIVARLAVNNTAISGYYLFAAASVAAGLTFREESPANNSQYSFAKLSDMFLHLNPDDEVRLKDVTGTPTDDC